MRNPIRLTVFLLVLCTTPINVYALGCELMKGAALYAIPQEDITPTTQSMLYSAVLDASKNSNYRCYVVAVTAYYGTLKKTGETERAAEIAQVFERFGPNEMAILEQDAEYQLAKSALGLNDFTAPRSPADTPLHIALKKQDFAEARRLIDSGADLNAPGQQHWRPLFVAAGAGDSDIVGRLLAQGVPPDQPATDGRTPLTQAAVHGRVDVVKTLIAGRAKVDAQDNNGGSSLLFAVMRNQLATADELIKLGATVDIPDANGLTPLMMAAHKGHEQMINLLLAAGADRTRTNQSGQRAIDLAREAGHGRFGQLRTAPTPTIDHDDDW